ncbi:MAG: D-TA family PLP-dependent enzyme [Chitinophagaceae bacterium]|nr:D-TA family PLP-dependent enzyme [Chitinophagaceae bacterium]
MSRPWYQIDDIDRIDSPALVFYPDRVKQNIDSLLGMIDDPRRLRPHVKTHKTREVVAMLMEKGVDKFKCATIAETAMVASIGASDILLAYQPVGPKVERLVELIQKYPGSHFATLVDDKDAANVIASAARASSINIDVFIDLNVGMNRTGILPDEGALELYEYCSALEGIRPIGLHAYDGHIYDSLLEVRESRAARAFEPVEVLRKNILKKGFAEPVIVAGGSPTFPFYARQKNIECSPGTFVFWDAGYAEYGEQAFHPAALLISRVISCPAQDVVCTDLGHKSVAAEKELGRRVLFLNAPQAEFVSQSEEHLTLRLSNGHGLRIGDVLYGLPFHICPTCALYEKAHTIKDGRLSGEWRIIARDRMITI